MRTRVRLLTLIVTLGLLAASWPAARAATSGGSADSVVGAAANPAGDGYWVAFSSGAVHSYGNLGFHGSAMNLPKNKPISAIAATPSGNGYWLAGEDGGVFAFGDAPFFGSMAGKSLSKPVVAMASTASGKGYWLAAADGAVFAFGDAPFRGSMSQARLSKPVVGIAGTPSGQGYWLVASDGGVFAFGDAQFFGSTAGLTLAKPIVNIVPLTNGTGYRLAGADGGVFAFGGATFVGSMVGQRIPSAVAALVRSANGYRLVNDAGQEYAFGTAAIQPPPPVPAKPQGQPQAQPQGQPQAAQPDGSQPRTSTGAGPSGPRGGVPAVRATTGFYPGEGNGPTEVQKFKSLEQWLGRPIPYVVLMNAYGSEEDFRNGIWTGWHQQGAFQDFGDGKPTAISSVPLAFGGYTPSPADGSKWLQEVVDGKHDDAYRYLASSLIDSGYPNAILRMGWELDGDWMPWSAKSNPELFKQAFRHVHDVMSSMSSQFRFDWCVSAGWDGKFVQWEDVYPGDAYVDIIGMDIYEMPGWTWDKTLPALQKQRDMAIQHGKQLSWPEWALDTRVGDDAQWVQNMLGWMADLPGSGAGSVAYMGWFNGNPGGDNGNHSIDHFPQGGAVFKQQLGG